MDFSIDFMMGRLIGSPPSGRGRSELLLCSLAGPEVEWNSVEDRTLHCSLGNLALIFKKSEKREG